MPRITYKTHKLDQDGSVQVHKSGAKKGQPKTRVAPSVTTITKKFDNERGMAVVAWRAGLEDKNIFREWDYKRGSGSLTHKMAENWLRGADIDYELQTAAQLGMHEDDYEPALGMARNALATFQEWWLMHGCELIEVEISLVSDEHNYGGTSDLRCCSSVYGSMIVDLKLKDLTDEFGAPKSLFHSTNYALQLGAYTYLWEHGRLNENQPGIRQDVKCLGEKIDRTILLYLNRNGTGMKSCVFDRDQTEKNTEAFLRLRQTYSDLCEAEKYMKANTK